MDTLTRMRTFIQVSDAGGFTAAANTAGRSKALISKYVSDLEDELGVRLLNRTTRQLSLTEAGEHYYREALEIVHRIDDLTSEVQDTNATPRGRLKISLPRTMGDGTVGLGLMEFARKYPDLTLSIALEDRFVNLVEEGFDVAIRVANMEDSSLIAKKLGTFEVISCASPDVLAAHGKPLGPEDLADKPCIVDTNIKPRNAWTYSKGNEKLSVTVRSKIELNSPNAVRLAALSSLGFARIPRIFIEDDLASGRLVEVLADYKEPDRAVYVVYPHRRHLPNKTRVFIDFISDWITKNDVRLDAEA